MSGENSGILQFFAVDFVLGPGDKEILKISLFFANFPKNFDLVLEFVEISEVFQKSKFLDKFSPHFFKFMSTIRKILP